MPPNRDRKTPRCHIWWSPSRPRGSLVRSEKEAPTDTNAHLSTDKGPRRIQRLEDEPATEVLAVRSLFAPPQSPEPCQYVLYVGGTQPVQHHE